MELCKLTTAIDILLLLNIVVHSKACRSVQYVEVGSAGIIQCSFEEDVYSVLWYDSTDFLEAVAIITLQDTVKSGAGFDSGEFDIDPNGSLIIKNVSIKHEGTYAVIKLDTPTSKPTTYTVSVSVIAPTFDRLPVISNCGRESAMCFQALSPNSDIFCMVRDARPAIPLNWMVRTIEDDRNISSRLEITNRTHTFFTSRVVTTDPFVFSDTLTFLVCKAYDPQGLLQKNESVVIVQNRDKALTNVEQSKIVAENGSRIELKCTDSQISYFVWQLKRSPESDFVNIQYGVFIREDITPIDTKRYKLQQTTFVVDKVRVQDEGTYRCISGNGFEDNVTLYNVVVFVYPDKGHLTVEGCTHQQYCTLEVQPEGSVTCFVKRIHPLVDLDITGSFEPSSSAIFFYDKTTTIKDNGDTFDVFLTSKYLFNGVADSRLTAECKVLGTDIDVFDLSTKFDLLFLHGVENKTEENSVITGHPYRTRIVALASLLGLFLCCGLLCITAFCRRRISRRQKRLESKVRRAKKTREIATKEGNTGSGNIQHLSETIPLISSEASEKKNIFISQLKAKYQDLYGAIQPIPYIRDRLHCVDRVFVESGIECKVARPHTGGQVIWEKLFTYQSILNDDRVKSLRRIIEGEPGYGKSTLTLQFTYDWCNKVQFSHLQNIDILILIRLRQLGGVSSIYRAIKQFLLPKDSVLTERDVADILSKCSSVLVILDGYDEYPDKDVEVDSDVKNIITRKMFQQFEVIITTRSSFLPKDYPALTKRYKLTGFDNEARDQYIQKAVVGNNIDAANEIKQNLRENPLLGDLCQVPLFFVMFAHMSHESKRFQKFNCVTNFFRYMISCFHRHMKNKMSDENVTQYELNEKEHTKLNQVAFEGLSGRTRKIVWRKEDLCERLGKDFYNQYVRTGILVEEEEVLDISDEIQYKTEVRFYHKLFCEWYAAHQLAEFASRNDVDYEREGGTGDSKEITERVQLHYLEELDPSDVEYVFRFACGLNLIASERIIDYLRNRDDAANFVNLCILEQRGNEAKILQEVKELCSKEVTIKNDDNVLLRRSTIQLLEIAAKYNISISEVYLRNCYVTADLPGDNLHLKPNLSIPVLTTLNKIIISEDNRKIKAEEFAAILQYTSNCLSLKQLEFMYCLLPQSVQAESLSVLRSRSAKVMWAPSGILDFDGSRYQLQLSSGGWQRLEFSTRRVVGLMTVADYQREVYRFS